MDGSSGRLPRVFAQPDISHAPSAAERRGWTGLADCLRERGQSFVGAGGGARTRNRGADLARGDAGPVGAATPHGKCAVVVNRRRIGPGDGVDSDYLAPKIVPPDAIPGARIEFRAGVVWFSLAISLLSCLLCGLAPALAVARSDIQTALKDSSRGSTAGRKSQRFRQAMIVAEAAVAVMLLASAGIMIESLRDLTHSNPGFDPKNVVTVRLVLPAATYDAERALRFYRRARSGSRRYQE